MPPKYVKRGEACEIIGIHYHTLIKMAQEGQIKTVKIGKQTLYDVSGYLKELENKSINEQNELKMGKNSIEKQKEILEEKHLGKERKKISYCRVSSRHQKEDLDRQIEMIKAKYPNHELISDIGGGMNYERKGLKKIMDMAMDEEIEELVIAYKDRLMRFGYEIIEYMVEKKSRGKIIILHDEEKRSEMEELTEDVVAIMNVYVAKVNGMRKYKSKNS